MIIPKYQLLFDDANAKSHESEGEFLDALQRSKRPFKDASFKVKRNVASKASAINVGGIIIATAAGCPMHLETDPDPQYSLLIPMAGSGLIAQGHRTVHFGGTSIIRSSYQKPLIIDYSHYAGVTIRTRISHLLKALNVEDADKEKVSECLLDTDLEQLPPAIGNVDYYGTIRSVLAMIDSAGCDESQLERIGFHSLLTGIIADLTLKVDRRVQDLLTH